MKINKKIYEAIKNNHTLDKWLDSIKTKHLYNSNTLEKDNGKY